jgi:hypothetical protein
MNRLPTLLVLAAASFAAPAFAQDIRFSEIFINPPGGDNGNEFFEISGPPGASLAGIWIVTIDGDNNAAGNSTATGVVDFARDLSAFSLGSNGLLLLRDSATVTPPGPAPETTVIAGPDFVGCGTTSTSNIDIENGAATYLLVRNFTGAPCLDLDVGNDGTLDSTPWSQVLDSVGFANAEDVRDPVLQNLIYVYATQLGGIDVSDRRPDVVSPNGFTPDFIIRTCNATIVADSLGAAPGPWGVDAGEVLFFPASAAFEVPLDYTLTPGVINPCPGPVVPSCGTIDFNGDGLFPDDSDLVEFLTVLAGGDCTTGTCDVIDFNRDGLFPDDNDLVDFLTVLAGGTPAGCNP